MSPRRWGKTSLVNRVAGMSAAKGFIERLTPKIGLSPDPGSDYYVSLGITPKTHSPEEVLSLPEKIAQRKGCELVICIDEFQQVGEFPDKG